MNKFLIVLPFLVVPFALSATQAERFGQDAAGSLRRESRSPDTLVKFEGGIGVLPVASGVGQAATATVVNRNIVRGVQPAGQIWVIAQPSLVRCGDPEAGRPGLVQGLCGPRSFRLRRN